LSFILFAHVSSPAIFGGVLIASYGMLTYYDLVPVRSSGNLSSSSSSSSNSDSLQSTQRISSSIDSAEKNRTATTPRSRRGVVL